MPRTIVLFSGPFADLPLATLAAKAGSEWGYRGLELCTWGDHFDIRRASAEEGYRSEWRELLAENDLQLPVIAGHKIGQAISDLIDDRHRRLVPDHVWGDGLPEGVSRRAAAEMAILFQVAERMGVGVVSGFTGSPIWSYVVGYPAPGPGVIAEGFRKFVAAWNPLLDIAADHGIRFACEVHPGQMAYDFHSAGMVLEALRERPEFGFTFDPAHLHWQGVDPVAFLRQYAERIYHVHIKDATLTLDGRSSVLAGHWPSGDVRRGFQFRSPGRGGIDWEAIIRTLNEIGYEGPLSIDWHDPGMDREFGAAEARHFVRQLDFDPPQGLRVHRERGSV